MEELAEYNKYWFEKNFYDVHGNMNKVLTCENNILTYNGETKIINGSITVSKDEFINLGTFRMSSIDNQVWKLEPYLFFFNIRETIFTEQKDQSDLDKYIISINQISSKNYLSQIEVNTLNNFIDYYNSLKQIEPTLRGSLRETYLKFNTYIIDEAKKINNSNITQGYRLIQEKLFGQIINDEQENNSSSMEQSFTRVKRNSNIPKSHMVSPIITDIYSSNDKTFKSDAAYITCIALILVILASVIGLLTFIFS